MKAFDKSCPQMLLAANRRNGLRGVGKRYAALCVLSKMYRKLLFNNFSIVWNIKILLITLSGGSTDDVCKVLCKLVKSPGRSSKK